MHRSDIDWHVEQVSRAKAPRKLAVQTPDPRRRGRRMWRAVAVISDVAKLMLIFALMFGIGSFLGAPL
jgi:hypothetical protein